MSHLELLLVRKRFLFLIQVRESLRFLNLNPAERAFNLLQSFSLFAKQAHFFELEDLISVGLLVYFLLVVSVGLFQG